MKRLFTFSLLVFLLCQRASSQNLSAFKEEQKHLIKCICNIICTPEIEPKTSSFFSVKAEIDAKGKVNALFFSENTPELIKMKLDTVLSLQINWNKLKPQAPYSVVIPISYVIQQHNNIIQLSALDILYSGFAYSNGNLFGNKPLKNYLLLEPIVCTRLAGKGPIDRQADSSDLK